MFDSWHEVVEIGKAEHSICVPLSCFSRAQEPSNAHRGRASSKTQRRLQTLKPTRPTQEGRIFEVDAGVTPGGTGVRGGSHLLFSSLILHRLSFTTSRLGRFGV